LAIALPTGFRATIGRMNRGLLGTIISILVIIILVIVVLQLT
jgi:hypothetical protein